MSILFVRTPRYLWPYSSERSSFWPPLGLACLAAALRAAGHGDVAILDAPVLKLGWRSLEAELRERRPRILCIGEETVSAPEGLRAADLAKELFGDQVTVVAGGHFFSYMEELALLEHGVDVVVRFEGEETLVELVDELARDQPRLERVRGIAYREGDVVRRTPPRPLIEDLDALPLPAYDLLPMELYGKGARNHPDLGAIEHSRGCIGRCSYCILWRTMGEQPCDGDAAGRATSRWRTKSPERTMEEVDLLVRGHGRRTLGWVDSTWNVDPEWTDAFSDLLLSRGYEWVQSTQWLRADLVLRDEELGLLDKQVRAGLVQAIMGIERPQDEDLRRFDKVGHGADVATRVARLFRSRYPSVFTIGSFIYGVADETVESQNHLVDFAGELEVDYSFLLCLTPNPGTREWRQAQAAGLIEVDDFRAYNFQTPIMRTHHMSRNELQRRVALRAFRNLFLRALRGEYGRFPGRHDARRRSARTALVLHSVRFARQALLPELWGWVSGRAAPWQVYAIRPTWYDS